MTSISKILLIDEMHKHGGVKPGYISERRVSIDGITIPLLYCNICDIYMCPKRLYDVKLKGLINNKYFKEIKNNDYIHDTSYIEHKLNNIRLNKLSSFELEHKGHLLEKKILEYNDQAISFDYCKECDSYGVNDKIYSLIKEKVNIKEPLKTVVLNNHNNYDLRKRFNLNHIDHNISDVNVRVGNRIMKVQYCKDCNVYNLDEETFKNYFEENFDGNVMKEIKHEHNSSIPNRIDCLIRVNSFSCRTKGHSIEEVAAIVNVFNKRTESIEEVEIQAFYCKHCRLFFIYDREYRLLLRHGIPTCPVHEEAKYLGNNKGFDGYNSESLLRQFGYNVSVQDNLSDYERQRIIRTVINNGIMTKNDVLSLLNFLASSRKHQWNMQSAVSKWNSDIDYTRTISSSSISKKVIIGAFRKKF